MFKLKFVKDSKKKSTENPTNAGRKKTFAQLLAMAEFISRKSKDIDEREAAIRAERWLKEQMEHSDAPSLKAA